MILLKVCKINRDGNEYENKIGYHSAYLESAIDKFNELVNEYNNKYSSWKNITDELKTDDKYLLEKYVYGIQNNDNNEKIIVTLKENN